MRHGQWENGKGSGDRTTDRKRYRKGYEQVVWPQNEEEDRDKQCHDTDISPKK